MLSGIEIFATLFGILILGSAFAIISNSTVDRIPKRQSVVYPAPFCTSCATQFKAKDLIPVYSFLMNKGTCPYCNAKLLKRNFYLDIAEILWVATYVLIHGWSWNGFFELLFGMGLIAIMAIEMEKKLLTDQILIYLGTLGIIHNLAFHKEEFPTIAIALGIGASVMIIYNLLKIIFKIEKRVSLTEIKLGAALGIIVGYPYVLLALYLGLFLSAAYGSFRIKFSKIAINNAIPGFPTAMALGTLITILFGTHLIQFYQKFISILQI